jgi:hypothetical protein
MGKYNINSGQSLIEIIIAVTIGAILIGGTTSIIVPILKSNLQTRVVQSADLISQKYLENIQSIAESDWHAIYNPPAAKGPGSQFYLTASGTTYAIISGTTSTIGEGKNFTIYFSIENANRQLCGIGNIIQYGTTTCPAGPGSTGVAEDPSTQKITAFVSWEGQSINKIQYFTRHVNKVFVQTDWSGGPGQEGPIASPNDKFASSTNIDYATTTGSIILYGF